MFSPRIDRRRWLQGTAAGIASMSGWLGALAARAATGSQPPKSVIVLWMNGGPSTIDLWDLKPGAATGGPFREIPTAVPGIQISEHLPKLASLADRLAIVRSMSTPEGDHERASFLLRTGYSPQGAIQFPALGSLLCQEIGRGDVPLPSFVSIAPNRRVQTIGGGFLGPQAAPLVVGQDAVSSADLAVADLSPDAALTDVEQVSRQEILSLLDRRFASRHAGPAVAALETAKAAAGRMMQPAASDAFRLEQETDTTRDAYGRTLFGQGCLLARRLVERGVSFVEVSLDGWDTHRDNFRQVQQLSGIVDGAFSALVSDLAARGLLESTLVVWQGEFGRTPKINDNTGRDHWPRAWSAVLAGGGVRGGQVVGRTSPDGTEAIDRPIGVPDLIGTVCRLVGVDPRKQNMSNVSRPIRIADPAAQVISELL